MGIKFEQTCKKCNTVFLISASHRYDLCKNCRQEESKKNLIKKYGSLENYYKQRTALGQQAKIKKYGSIEKAYEIAIKKGLETKKQWSKEIWDEINARINHTKSLHTEEQRESARKKRHETILEKYGSESNLAIMNRTKFRERVGEDEYKKHQNELGKKISEIQKNFTIEKKKQIKEKTTNTIIERYGTIDNYQSILKEKRSKSNLEKYGAENPFQWDSVKEKSKETRKKRYGDKNYNNRELYYKTCLERYGTRGIVHHAPKYTLNGENFDSSWEVYYYIWLVDQKIDFTFHPKDGISYFDEKGKEHTFYVDFIVNGELIEIKGDHLYRNGFLTSPSGRHIFYAKTKCYKDNNVKILSWSTIKPIKDYIDEKYGKNYVKTFKVN